MVFNFVDKIRVQMYHDDIIGIREYLKVRLCKSLRVLLVKFLKIIILDYFKHFYASGILFGFLIVNHFGVLALKYTIFSTDASYFLQDVLRC